MASACATPELVPAALSSLTCTSTDCVQNEQAIHLVRHSAPQGHPDPGFDVRVENVLPGVPL